MFPLRDENPRVHPPITVVLIIVANALAWALLQGFGSEAALAKSICEFGLIPGDLLGTAPAGSAFPLNEHLACVLDGDPSWLTTVSSMFMHGGWFHIIGNMWFLWVFGDNVEDVMGPVRFAVFYLLCGFAAAGAQVLTDSGSIVPMVGASGAIGGVMGAYALLFPRAHVHTFVFVVFYMTTISVPALFMLGYWFLLQVLSGLPGLGEGATGGVAFWAHVGGFLAGVVLARVFTREDYLALHRAQGRHVTARHRWL